FFKLSVLLLKRMNRFKNILRIFKSCFYLFKSTFFVSKILFYGITCNSLYPTDSGCHCSFRGDLEMPDVCGVFSVTSSTKFDTFTRTTSPYIVSVFLTEKCHRSFFNGLLKRNRTFFY